MEIEVPVYLFTGFIDSGKTTLLNETIFKNNFTYGMKRFVVVLCEEGDEKVDKKALRKLGGDLVIIPSKAEFTTQKLLEIDDKYHPEAVFIEFNGTWESDTIFEIDAPGEWVIAQTLCSVDSATFEMYMQNMRNMMVECMNRADVVIFNRFNSNYSKSKFRANVKSVNRPAQIVYEKEDGSIDESEEEMPFDITADEIEITDADYGIWFMDCMDHPEKYDGKTISYLGIVYNPKNKKANLEPGTFVCGRFAMTCCADDIQFLGMKCVSEQYANELEHKAWVNLKAKIKKEFAKEYHGDGPILYPIEVTMGEKPEDELVYFS